MRMTRGGRVLLLSAAVAAAAGTAGVALGNRSGADASAHVTHVRDVAALRNGNWKWSFSADGGKVIEVRSPRCPKDHPHKVGSFSYRSTRIDNGRLERHSSKGSLCAK
jgi:hypothetical protein